MGILNLISMKLRLHKMNSIAKGLAGPKAKMAEAGNNVSAAKAEHQAAYVKYMQVLEDKERVRIRFNDALENLDAQLATHLLEVEMPEFDAELAIHMNEMKTQSAIMDEQVAIMNSEMAKYSAISKAAQAV